MIPAEEPTVFAVRRSATTTATVITVVGEIDTDESAVLRAEAVAAVEAAHVEAEQRMVVIDLSAVTFLGSIGLSTLVYVGRTAERLGTQLRGVTGVGNRAVVRPLQLMGSVGKIGWHPTLDEALSAPGMY